MKTITLARIAARSAWQNPKRSLLFGSAISFSAFLMLLTLALYKGAGDGVERDTRELFTGEVGVFWDNIDDYSQEDVSRLFGSRSDPDEESANARARAFVSGLEAGEVPEIAVVRRHSLRNLGLSAGTKAKASMLYFAKDADLGELVRRGVLESASPEPLELGADSIWIGQDLAKELGLSAGDFASAEARSSRGAQNAMDLRIGGVFKNKAPWINMIAFCGDGLGRELYDEDPGCFDVAKVFAMKGTSAQALRDKLGRAIAEAGLPLKAETGEDAGSFFLGIATSSRAMSAASAVMIFLVIGLGLRSTTRVLLYQRMRETGALRAIGYSRADCLSMAIAESAFLALAALLAALAAAGLAVLAIDLAQLRVPDGPLLYLFGSDRFHPSLRLSDCALCLVLVTAMAVIAPLKPALELSGLPPAEMLAGGQGRWRRRRVGEA